MTKIGYQLFDLEGNFSGYYIWTTEEQAQAITNMMNEDRAKCGLNPSLSYRKVEIMPY